MKKKLNKFLIVVLAVVMAFTAFAMFACKPEEDGPPPEGRVTENKTLTIASGEFNGKFNPFFAKTAYDTEVWEYTQAEVWGIDRNGEYFLDGIEGTTTAFQGVDYTYYSAGKIVESRSGENYVYTITIRDDIKFTDGHVADVDDLIFYYYVLADPAYTGASTFYSLEILGLDAYRTGTLDYSDENLDLLFETYKNVAANVTKYKAVVKEAFEEIYEVAVAYYADYEYDTAYEFFADLCEIDIAGAPAGGEKEFLLNLAAETYWDDGVNFDDNIWEDPCVIPALRDATRGIYYAEQGSTATASKINGIERVNNTTLKITMSEYNASVYSRMSAYAVPLHYYGSETDYNYSQNKFGFTKGNLDSIKANNSPMGAGPYKFKEFTSGIVTLEANTNFYQGVPYIRYIELKEQNEDEIIAAVGTGDIDAGNPSYSVATVNEIKTYNSNNTVDGDAMTVRTTLNLGYGYIGISANSVKLGTDIGSEESKALRKGFATLFAVYREQAYNTHYADAAEVIEYPISKTSWAAPMPTDEGYEIAYSRNAAGNKIYTDTMTQQQRYTEALSAAISWFEAAGFTRGGDGKFGGIGPYTAVVPGGGTGNHPNFAVLSNTRDVLATIGITIHIDDRSSTSTLFTDVEAGTVAMWTMAWQAEVDPDMHQLYHSSNVPGAGGTSSNHYYIQDDTLDQLIIEARKGNKAERKALYKIAMDIVLDWGVEIPAYQRLNAFLFSTKRVDVSTVCVVSPYYKWMNEVHNVKMK